MPSIQGEDSFDHGFDVPADYDAVFSTPAPIAVDTPQYLDEPKALEIVSGTGNTGVRKNITGAPSRGWTGFALEIGADPTTTSITVAAMLAVTSNFQARIAVNTDGLIFAFISGGGTTPSGPDIVADPGYHWIEYQYDLTQTTHRVRWRVDDVLQTPAELTGQTAGDTVSYGQLLSATGNGVSTWHGAAWKWGTASSDDDWHGEPSIEKQSFYVSRRRSWR